MTTKEFHVRHGLVVGNNILVANIHTNAVSVQGSINADTIKVSGSAIPTGEQSNAMYELVNATFGHTNSTLSHSQTVYGAVNSVFEVANAAYNNANSVAVSANNYAGFMANSANAYTEYTLNISNTTLNHLIGERANASNVFISSVYDVTNVAFGHSNITYAAVNSAFGVINAAFASANNVAPQIAPAFNTANSGYNQANTATGIANYGAELANANFTRLSAAYVVANSNYVTTNAGYTVANAAFDAANTKFSSSGGTVTGSVSIVGDLIISGNTRQIGSDTLRVSDPLIYLAGNNYSSDIVDIGFIANYVNTGGANVHTGLYREHENKEYYLFQGYDSEPINNHIGALSNNMTLAVLNADVRTSNLNLGGANAIVWIRTAFDTINAAYTSSNADYVLTNAAFNSVNSVATAANNYAGAMANAVNGAFATADSGVRAYVNTSTTSSNNYAGAMANSSNAWATATFATITNATAAFAAANAEFTFSNTIYAAVNSAFAVINAAYTSSNADYVLTNAAYTSINAGYTVANAAFGTANARVSSVSGTSGRITSSGGTAPTIDLATAGAGAATYSSGVSSITVDAYGRVTSVTGSAGYVTSSGVTSVAAGTGLSGGTITSTGTISMPNVGPGAGSYSSGISALTIDAQGRITAITGSASYATTTQLASYLPLSGGTMTGRLIQGSVGFGVGGRDDISTRINSGFWETSSATTAEGWPENDSWYHLMTSTHSNDSNYFSMQFAGDFYNSNDVWYRATNNNGLTAWNRLWHSGNDGAGTGLDADLLDGQQGSFYASASSLGNYLPLAGGSMTGNISYVANSGNGINFNGTDTTMHRIYLDGFWTIFKSHSSEGWRFRDNGNTTRLEVLGATGQVRIAANPSGWNAAPCLIAAYNGDGFIQTRHIRGKDTSGTGTDNLYVNWDGLADLWNGRHIYSYNYYDRNDTGFYLDANDVSRLLITNINYLRGSRTINSAYNSSNTLLETPAGIEIDAGKFIRFTNGVAPFALYRTSGDMPAPYGIGWGNGGESSGIFQRLASNGSSFGEMIFSTSNDGSGSFAFRRGTWEGTSFQPSGSNHYGTLLASIDWGGNFVAIGNITAYFSDKRLKTDIKPISNAIEKIKAISGITYRNNELAKSFGYKDEEEQVGVLAQDVEKVMPQVVKLAPFDCDNTESNRPRVSKTGENYKTVMYDKLVPLLIQAIKEQQEQIDELKRRLENN